MTDRLFALLLMQQRFDRALAIEKARAAPDAKRLMLLQRFRKIAGRGAVRAMFRPRLIVTGG